MKIVCVVPNAATRDVRILKQAKSLDSKGHDVTIVGIKENKFPSYRTQVDPGIDVFRVEYASEFPEQRKKDVRNFIVRNCALISGLILLVNILLYEFFNFGDIISNVTNYCTKYTKFFLNSSFYNSIFPSSTDYYWLVNILLFLVILLFLSLLVSKFRKIRIKKIHRVRVKSFLTKLNSYFNVRSKRTVLARNQSEKIKELEPDLIYCNEVMSLPGCVIAKKALKVPLIYDAHEFYDDLEGENIEAVNSLNSKTHKKLFKHVQIFVTVSETILSLYKEKYEKNLPKTTLVLPNSVVLKQISRYDGRLHSKTGLPLDTKILLYQGGMTSKRMVDEVIKSGKDNPENWSIVIMGTGKERIIFEKFAEEINTVYIQESISKKYKDFNNAKLVDKRNKYFSKLSMLGDEPIQLIEDQHMILGESEALADYKKGDLNIEKFVGNFIGPMMRKYSSKVRSKISDKAKQLLRENLTRDIKSILGEVETISNINIDIYDIQINLANALAIHELALEESHNYIPRVSIIDPVPQEDLLSWTQGASIGIIPYPITCSNHWGCAPNKLWEYPAANVPIISTPTNEISKIIKQYEIGWTISSDPKASEISFLLNRLTEEEIDKKKDNTKKFINDSNWEIHTNSLFKAIDNLLN
jgi:glycosyltransferase involved in cell wall biosynthesis